MGARNLALEDKMNEVSNLKPKEDLHRLAYELK